LTRTCPQHHHADDVLPRLSMDGIWEFTCDRPDHEPPGPYTWMGSNDGGAGPISNIGRTLGPLTSPLLNCLNPGEPWVEYGVVEWRFRILAPSVFDDLVQEHGHIVLNPRAEKGWTASAYLVHALVDLRREGRIDRIFGAATGPWERQPEVSYWATPPTPPTTTRLSWAEFAAREGVSPI
jgi:hypothetical protein